MGRAYMGAGAAVWLCGAPRLRADAERRMAETVGALQTTLETRTAELREMQSRLIKAKESYEVQAARKQAEVAELEDALVSLDERNVSMNGYVGQVRSQITEREEQKNAPLVRACICAWCAWVCAWCACAFACAHDF